MKLLELKGEIKSLKFCYNLKMRSVQRGISATFLVIAILAITVASTAGYFAFSQNLKEKIKAINSFEECAAHFAVMESYPEQCNTPDGKHFVRELSEQEKEKLKTPGEVSIENWKPYVNTKYNFSIDYPVDYFKYINELETSTSQFSVIFTPRPLTNDLPSGFGTNEVGLTMTVIDSDSDISLEGFLDQEETKRYYSQGERKPITVGGLKGYEIIKDFTDSKSILPYTAFFKKDNEIYRIDLNSHSADTLTQYKSLFDKIVLTFKLL